MSSFTSSSLRSLMRSAPSAAAPARSFSSSSARALARMNITGRLGNTPELQTSQNGKQYVRYTVATTHGKPGDRQTSWFRVIAFLPDSQRDFLLNVPKGTLVSVDADAQNKKYQDSEGKEHTAMSLSQRHIEVLRRPFNPNFGENNSEEAQSPSEEQQ